MSAVKNNILKHYSLIFIYYIELWVQNAYIFKIFIVIIT